MGIQEIIAAIPEDNYDEALLSIQSIVTDPGNNSARLRCYLANEFRLVIQAKGNMVTLTAEDRADLSVPVDALLGTLKREIYEIDELMSRGCYKQTPPKENIIMDDRPPPPADFDIPIWDVATGAWRDAEY